MKHIIELAIKEKRYQKEKQAVLKDFELTVSKGENIAIMGKSGIGKTTLLNILGLLDTHFKGEYHLFGHDTDQQTSKEKARIRNEKIGFILQESALINSITVEANIKLPLLYANHKKDTADFYHEITHKMGIQSILSKKPLECSGGQRSRAVIARALMLNPSVILADEPTASLDEDNKWLVFVILKELNNNGSTIITVTHDKSVAEKHDKLIRLG